MLQYDTSLLENRCRALIDQLGDQLTWKWDNRFETVLAEFPVKATETVKQILSGQMDIVWHQGNTAQAPELIHILVDYFGGLNPGQQMFTSDPEIDGILLCAWWPWGNGKTISIRLAAFADSLSDEENEELTKIFRSWFKV